MWGSYSRGHSVWVEAEMLMEQEYMSWKPEPHAHLCLLMSSFPTWVKSHIRHLHFMTESEVAQSCPPLCDSMDCSLPGSYVHGIFQARVLEWVTISFSRESSWPRDRTWFSCVAGRFFAIWATREVNTLYVTQNVNIFKICRNLLHPCSFFRL